MLRSKSPAASFRHALNGLLLSFKTQRHLRIHFVLGFLALGAGFVWQLSRAEILVLVGSISLVILAEMFNTALETVVDLVTPEYHPLAKVAKDVAAGAVLVAAVNAVLVGVVLFFDVDRIRQKLHSVPEPVNGVQIFAIGLLMLFLVLVIWKVKGGKGRFLQGGVVSGHSAIAFFLGTLILLLAPNPLVGFLAILLAILVSQSRVETGVHSLREVFFGAILGVLIPVLLCRLIPLLLRALVIPRPGAGH